MSLLKTADTSAVKSGDTITYTITITNSGTITNTNLFFTDPTPSETTFVDGSVEIDDTSNPSFNPQTGFNLSDLEANQTIIVNFKVKIN